MLKSVSSGAEAHCKPSTYCPSPSTLPQAGSLDQLKLRPPKKPTFSASCKATTHSDSRVLTLASKSVVLCQRFVRALFEGWSKKQIHRCAWDDELYFSGKLAGARCRVGIVFSGFWLEPARTR